MKFDFGKIDKSLFKIIFVLLMLVTCIVMGYFLVTLQVDVAIGKS